MAQVDKSKDPTTRDPSKGAVLDDIRDATETIALSPGIGISGAAPAGYQPGLDLGKIADQTIAGVLGGPVGSGDLEQMLDRLSAVFPETTSNGVTTFTYRPIGAQPSNGSSGALVAGAQATIYQQAQALGQSIYTLLDTMEPVITDPDTAEIEALKDTVRSTVGAIVEELGREGGAVIQRITALKNILGTAAAPGALQELETKLGLGPQPEEDDTLDLAILKDELIRENAKMLELLITQLTSDLVTLYSNKVLTGVSIRYAQLVWVVRAIPMTIQQIYQEFDAIRFDSNDRRIEIVQIPPTKGVPGGPISIEQALQWCESSASAWAQTLAGSARIEDLKIINGDATILQAVIAEIDKRFHPMPGSHIRPIPGSLRVTAALDELQSQLGQIKELLGPIVHPGGALAKPKRGAAE